MKEQDLLSLIALSNVPDIGPHRIRSIISYIKDLSTVFDIPKSKLLKIPGLGEKSVNAILQNKHQIEKAAEILSQNRKLGIQTVAFGTEDYPKRLKDIKDAPLIFYYQGTANLNHSKIIAIVGTRKATTYGLETTRKLIKELVPYNCLIISGLAYGIDIAAHKAALEFGLPTIGVMANGMDRVYPTQHKHIASQMTTNGGLLTENKLGTKPDAPLFPARNRIIAGMADAVIVVEATKKGGACITAEIANSYYKDVFAVPGDINSIASEGCNNLIRTNKAQLLTSARELEYFLNWQKNNTEEKVIQKSIDTTLLLPEEKSIIDCLSQSHTLAIDELSWKSSIPINQLASSLLNLEFQGMVKQLPGKKFQLCKN